MKNEYAGGDGRCTRVSTIRNTTIVVMSESASPCHGRQWVDEQVLATAGSVLIISSRLWTHVECHSQLTCRCAVLRHSYYFHLTGFSSSVLRSWTRSSWRALVSPAMGTGHVTSLLVMNNFEAVMPLLVNRGCCYGGYFLSWLCNQAACALWWCSVCECIQQYKYIMCCCLIY